MKNSFGLLVDRVEPQSQAIDQMVLTSIKVGKYSWRNQFRAKMFSIF
jgi:hypothetical protein